MIITCIMYTLSVNSVVLHLLHKNCLLHTASKTIHHTKYTNTQRQDCDSMLPVLFIEILSIYGQAEEILLCTCRIIADKQCRSATKT